MDPELIALLGRRDSPTDALEDYSTWLGRALAEEGYHLRPVRVPWAKVGWMRALRWLWRDSAQWKGKWVLVQYTALSWSRRGFPWGLLAVLLILKRRQLPIAVVFHDVTGYPGRRLVDRIRRKVQHSVMQQAYRRADKAILTVPLERVLWLPCWGKAVFIPVGANIPEPERKPKARDQGCKTVAVFGVTGGQNTPKEVADITYTVRRASQALAESGQRLRLVVLGRGSEEARDLLMKSLDSGNVEASVLGLLRAETVAEVLSQTDVLLFVRGHISSRRGSALAGIACGLPIVAYAGEETGHPITEAGVLLVPQGDREALAEALVQVLEDGRLWQELHRQSLGAQREYFSWDTIAQKLLHALKDERA